MSIRLREHRFLRAWLCTDSTCSHEIVTTEYLPSVLHVAKDGIVITRVVPTGTEGAAAGSGATVVASFPATVGANFRTNRGFEGIAVSPDGRTLYTALQSPMDYRPAGVAPPAPSPRNSLAVRVFRLDITDPSTPAVTGQWIYRLDKRSTANSPLADKVSTLPGSAPKCLWADVAKLLRDAGITDPNDPSDPPRAGNGKIEGAAYVPARGANPAVLGVINDNDFGLVVPIPEQLDILAAPTVCVPV